MKTVYVSGKITDISNEMVEENIETALTYAKQIWKLTMEGYSVGVFCPHGNDQGVHRMGVPYEALMEYDLWNVENHDAIFMCPNWQDSPGSKRELEHAQNMGKKVLYNITDVREWLDEHEEYKNYDGEISHNPIF